jgi:hypothetical protein
MGKQVVHRIFDTAGQMLDRQNHLEARGYQHCGGEAGIFVIYRDSRVQQKQWA